jgi:hypothetical protein
MMSLFYEFLPYNVEWRLVFSEGRLTQFNVGGITMSEAHMRADYRVTAAWPPRARPAQAPKPPVRPGADHDLEDILNRLDRLLTQASDAVLKPGADKTDLLTLSEVVLGGAPIPPDLETWFRWHNGQENYDSPSPDDSFTLLSIQQAIDAWRFLCDPEEEIQKPWQSSWLPLFYNFGGDYVVLETQGEQRGMLLGYWHDSRSRKVRHRSLSDWARKLEKVLAKAIVPGRERMRLEVGSPTWEKWSFPPLEVDLSALPVGTVLCYRKTHALRADPFCIVWLKAGPNAWITAMHNTPGSALDELQTRMDKKRPPSDWECRTDKSLGEWELVPFKVLQDADQPWVGLYCGQIVVHGTEIPHQK